MLNKRFSVSCFAIRSDTLFLAFVAIVFSFSCAKKAQTVDLNVATETSEKEVIAVRKANPVKTIHVVVALCDNESQGIVPVPAAIGDGDKPSTNLYWGARYGVRTYFERSKAWKRLETEKPEDPKILERAVFKHLKTSAILVADAHRGSEIKKTTIEFVGFSKGRDIRTIKADGKILQIGGGADIIAYIGHNGLMDFKIPKQDSADEPGKRDAIVLACFSKRYFSEVFDKNSTNPITWTTNFMAPEGYVLHGALEKRLAGKNGIETAIGSAQAYAKYQRISLRAAKGLFTEGW